MPDYQRVPIDKILIGPRRRPIDPAEAAVIGASLKEHGQLQPIIVRPTPAAARPYTLVIGGHRCVGAEIAALTHLDALVVKATTVEAQMLEIVENLHRHDLSVLDRAFFVQGYRELFEQRYGKIEAGRPENGAKFALLTGEGVSNFSDYIADKLGFSKRAAQYLGKISRDLHPDLRAALQGNPLANNQQKLLSFAKLEPKRQRQLAVALKHQPDPAKALALINPPPKLSPRQADQAVIFSRLVTAWQNASDDTRQKFAEHAGLFALQAEAA